MSEFDKFARDYEAILSESIKSSGFSLSYFDEYKIKEIYTFVKSEGLRDNEIKFLNFGCGTGRSEKIIRKYFKKSVICSIDISEKSVAVAKENNKDLDNIMFKSFDGYRIPFDDKFDIIHVANVFHHIPHGEHQAVLEGIYQNLNKNGFLFIFEHNPFNPITLKIVRSCELDKDAKLLNPFYTNRILSQSGFEWRRIRFIHFFPKIFWFLFSVEKYLRKIPFGAQYYFAAKKGRTLSSF